MGGQYLTTYKRSNQYFVCFYLCLFLKTFSHWSNRKVSTGPCREAMGQCLIIYKEEEPPTPLWADRTICRLAHCRCTVSETTTCGLSVTCAGSTNPRCPSVPIRCPSVPTKHFVAHHCPAFLGPCVRRHSEPNFCPNYRPFGPAGWLGTRKRL